MRGIQVLIALVALFMAPVIGLVAPVFAFFAGTFGIAGLSAASWHKSVAATFVFTALQVAAIIGTVWLTLQPLNSDAPPAAPSAQMQPGGSMPVNDRAAP